jgi:hypothetical protein
VSAIDPLLERVLQADERLRGWYQAIDREWERLKQEHNARAGNPYGFTAHIQEMGNQAVASVKDDPKPETFAFLDQVADEFLKLTPEDRAALSDFFADCRYLERFHRAYVSARAAERLRATRDVAWLWRGIVIAALGQGGTDFRDLHLALADLWDAGKSAGLDSVLAFAQVGSLATSKPGRGGLKGSIRDFLIQYRR